MLIEFPNIIIYCNLNIDIIASQGRAAIEKTRQTQLNVIETNRVKQLEVLTQKFATADSAKSSMSYISIIFLGFLFGSVLLNDFGKVVYCVFRVFSRRRQVAQMSNNANATEKNNELRIHVDDIYSNELEERLERVHMNLLVAVHSQK